MEHLALEIFDLEGTGSKYATLEEDESITITDTSEVFASGDVWSHSFRLNVHANAHIFGTAGDLHGMRLHDMIDRRRARLWVEGLPLYLGYLRLDDEVEVDEVGNIDVSFESGQKTFDEMIEGAKANQVPMMSDVMIGLALWRKRKVSYRVKLKASASLVTEEEEKINTDFGDVYYHETPLTTEDIIVFQCDGEEEGTPTQQYPRMVFPKGDFVIASAQGTPSGSYSFDCINVDYPYDDEHPYCNVALCYQKYDYKQHQVDGTETEDYTAEPEEQRSYDEMPADRLNSAPNFFVIYWIKALMKHLGIYIEENQMMDYEDLRRLFFVNTKCDYIEPKKLRTAAEVDARFGRYKFKYSGRNIVSLIPEYYGQQEVSERGNFKTVTYDIQKCCIDTTKSHLETDGEYQVELEPYDTSKISPSKVPTFKGLKIDIKEIEKMPSDMHGRQDYERNNGYLHKAIATSECFPDVDISEVIKALEAGFGIRFLFSDDYKRVRIVLLRDIFRNNEIQDVACDIIDDVMLENSKRGFRLTYGVGEEDTTYYYKGFNDMLPHKKPYFVDNSDKYDYSFWNLDADYSEIIKKVSAFDKTCYVTPETGNAYGVKVDKDAKRIREQHPSLFEKAGYIDAEDGDCSGEEDTIETVNIGFKPALMNDLNVENERGAAGEHRQRFALFVDEKMQPRRPDLGDGRNYNDPTVRYDIYDDPNNEAVPALYGKKADGSDKHPGKRGESGMIMPGRFAIRSDMVADAEDLEAKVSYDVKYYYVQDGKRREGRVKLTWHVYDLNIGGYFNEGICLYLQDNFEPNDDGIAPVETHDWGLTLGIMRSSGDDASIRYEGDPDDGEGNDTWEKQSGSSATAHSDTCDNYGGEWDYNGDQSGIGSRAGRLSLKLRAEKPNPYFDKTKPESDENQRYLTITNEHLRGRGLADTLYKEYSYWVRNARIVKRTVNIGLAQLLTIDKTKKVRVGDVVGFIRKMKYTVSNKAGLGTVEFEIMYI